MPATWKRILTTGDNSNYKNSNLVASDLPLATSSAVGGVSVGSGLSVNGSGVLTADAQSGTVQTISVSGTTLTLSDGGGSVTLPDNDTQDLSISGRTISLTDGGSVTVPSSNVSTNLSVTHGTNDVTVASSDGTNASIGKATTSQAGVMTASYVSAMNANTAKVGITTAQANAITANSAKTGITTAQANAITANSAKTGITTAQANAITANTAKVSATKGNIITALAGMNENDTLAIGDSGNDCTVKVNGNLQVNGTTTTINTATLNVSDNVITLNSDVTGTPSQSAGIEVERGTSANPQIVWAENSDRWMLDYNALKANIATVTVDTATPGSSTSSVNGKGGFWLDTTNTALYVMLDG